MRALNWSFIRRCLAFRREEKRLLAQGYRRHETDWEIHRGSRKDERIVDAKVSVDGKYVYTKLGRADNINAKLSSLGINAETPEKVKELQASLNASAYLLDKVRQERDLAEARLADAKSWTVGQYEHADRLEKRLAELESELKVAENNSAELHALFLIERDRVAELERMIAEAPVYYCYRNATFGWAVNQHQTDSHTHRARLVQIEEIKNRT
jgi:hypothetical protein